MQEGTLVILKPDAIARGIMGEIVSRFEKIGLKIVGMKMEFATREQLEKHYYKDEEWLVSKGKGLIKNKGYAEDYDAKKAGQEIVDGLINDMMILPVVLMVIEGHNVVKVVKKLTGPTNIEEAMPGTIRGDYSHDTYGLANILNRPILTVIHASGEKHEAEHEIKIWFKPEEVHTYDRVDTRFNYRSGKI